MQYIKYHRLLLCLYVVIIPIAALASVYFSLCLNPVINIIYDPDKSAFVKTSVILVMFGLLDIITHYIQSLSVERLRRYYLAGLKRDLYSHYTNYSYKEFCENPSANYLSVITRDADMMCSSMFDSYCGIYKTIVCFTINFVFIIRIGLWIALINVIMGLLSIIIPKILDRPVIRNQDEASKQSKLFYTMLSDRLNGFVVLKTFRSFKSARVQIEDESNKMERANYQSSMANYSVSYICMLVSEIAFALTIIIGVWLAINGKMAVGMVFTVSQLAGGILVPIEQMPRYIVNLRSIKKVKERIEDVLGHRDEASSNPEADIISMNRISVDNLCFAYDKDLILNDISICLDLSKKYFLTGESGCGKSTFAKLLTGLYLPSSGKIWYSDKYNTENISENSLYKKVSYVEQNTFIFCDTVRNNITLFHDYTDEEIVKALKEANLYEVVNSLPEGLDTVLTNNGGILSGGERQRIGIARALITGAEFLILDEVTANLDQRTRESIENTLLSLDGKGFLMVSHNISANAKVRADYVLNMENGKIAC